jgi:predicted RecB family nuclease
VEEGKTLRTCKNGHKYYKSSDCPTCPTCEAENRPKNGFLSQISAPARRALENNGIKTVTQLSKFSESELLQFHGFGKSSLPKLRLSLEEQGLTFKN